MSEWKFEPNDFTWIRLLPRSNLPAAMASMANAKLTEYKKQYDAQIIFTHNLQAELSALKAEIETGFKVYGRRVPTGERVRWTEYSRPEDSYEALLIRMKPIGEK